LRCPGNDLIGAAGRCREFWGVPQFFLFLYPKIGGKGVERKREDNAGGLRFALPTVPARWPREASMRTVKGRRRSHLESLPFETIVPQTARRRVLDPREWVSVTLQDAPGLIVDWQSIIPLCIQAGADSLYLGFRTLTMVARSILQRARYCCSRLKL